MRSRVLHTAMLAALAPAALAAPAPKTSSQAAHKLIQNCDAHKFETIVDVTVDGQPHQSKVKLCGVEGQSDAEWTDTLRDAIKKLEANKDMPAAQREQIVTAIRSEIVRLSIVNAGPAMPRRSRPAVPSPAESLSRDYAMLPPLPPPREVTQAPPLSDPATPSPRQGPNDIAIPPADAVQVSRPPSAGVSPAQVHVAATTEAPVATQLASGLRFGCDTPGDLSTDAPCAEFERDTTITIHAAQDVPAGTQLQFVRNERPQADIALEGLRRGGTLRVALPPKVCAGFASGKLELRIVSDGANGVPQAVSSDGPYSLRC